MYDAMTMTNQNVTIWAGDTVNLNVVVGDGAGGLKDISGATIAWLLYDENAGASVLTKSTGSGITITSGAGGAFTVALAAADTEDVTPGAYYHEAEVTDTLGNISTVFIGSVKINRSRV